MPIDRAYLAIPSVGEGMEQGLKLGQLIRQSQVQNQQMADDQAMRQAYSQNLVTDENGNRSVNMRGVTQQLMGQNPQKAMELSEQDHAKNAGRIYDILTGIDSPEVKRQKLIGQGLAKPETLPSVLDEKWIDDHAGMFLQAKDLFQHRIAQQNAASEKQKAVAELGKAAAMRSDKQNDKIEKMVADMRNDFDADKGRAGNFGQISAKVQAADRLDGLVKSFEDGNLPPAQMEELSLGLANMLSGTGGAARAQVEALVPHTWTGKMMDVKQWLMNEPTGANQQKFVKMMAHTIEREKQISMNQLNEIRARRLPAHQRLKDLAPDRYNSMLQSYGLDTGKIVNGQYQPDVVSVPPTATYKTHEIDWADN